MATRTSETLRRAGLDALQRELGTTGMARFLQQFELGKGDYTSERWSWLPMEADIEQLSATIQKSTEKAD